jgi:hypothetical protein
MPFYRNEKLEEESKRQELIISNHLSSQVELQKQITVEKTHLIRIRSEVAKQHDEILELKDKVTRLEHQHEADVALVVEAKASLSKHAEDDAALSK